MNGNLLVSLVAGLAIAAATHAANSADAAKPAAKATAVSAKTIERGRYMVLPLSELKSGDEQGQKPCGRPTANALDEAPQGQG